MLKKDCTNYKYEAYSRCTAFGRIDSCARDCVRYLTRNLGQSPEPPVESPPEPVVASQPLVEEKEGESKDGQDEEHETPEEQPPANDLQAEAENTSPAFPDRPIRNRRKAFSWQETPGSPSETPGG